MRGGPLTSEGKGRVFQERWALLVSLMGKELLPFVGSHEGRCMYLVPS